MTRITRAQIVTVGVFLTAFFTTSRAGTPVRAAQDELPDGPGKAIVARACTECHGLDSITSIAESRRGWSMIVNDMVGRGAPVAPDQIDTVSGYLVASFGKAIKVNEITASFLSDALDIPTAKAQEIVDYRTKNGKFKTVDDILKIPEVNAARVKEQALNFVFE